GLTNESSKLDEGYALLGAIIDAQISYYNEWGNFYARVGNKAGGDFWTAVEPELGINAINNRYFTWFNACDGTGGSWYNLNGDGNFKYRFMAVVRSANAGTITIQYNLTQRFEPVVSGI
ncbi:MAG: hypothetical protein II816_02390, partial [Elusimicrobia bacterium]|nr:hypothetical protein [Elusimicrobiota bacterium]